MWPDALNLPQSLGAYGQMAQPAPQLQQTFGNYAFLPGGSNPYAGFNAANSANAARNGMNAMIAQGSPALRGMGAGPSNPMQALMSQFQQAQQRANAANIGRYNEAKGLYSGAMAEGNDLVQRLNTNYGNLYKRTQERATNMGKAEKQQIADRYTTLGAQQQQDMISRGLDNTTVRQATERGLERNAGREYGELNEKLRRERQELDIGLSKDRMGMIERFNQSNYGRRQDLAGLIERRNDTAPDMSQMYQMMFGMGRG